MRNVAALFIIGIALAGFAVFEHFQPQAASSVVSADAEFKPKAGFVAAPFRLPDLEDESVTVGSRDGKLQLVNFWASWCGPCELEAPDLQKLHEKYGDVMTLYGVNSTKYDRERSAREFVQDYGFTFPVLMDRDGDVTGAYKVKSYPTSFLIDAEGVIRERIDGVITYEAWEGLIEKYL